MVQKRLEQVVAVVVQVVAAVVAVVVEKML